MKTSDLIKLGLTPEQAARLSRNGQYWKIRFGQVEQAQHDRGVQAFQKIDAQYRQAQKDIEAKIDAWYRRFADNEGITLQEARKMLDAKQLAEFKWDVNDYIRYGQENAISGQWAKELENASARFHISRLEALKVQCQQDVEVLFGAQADIFDQAMRDIYKSGYYHNAFELQKGIGVGWDFSALDPKHIDRVINTPWTVDGRNFSTRIWDSKEKLIGEIDQTLTQNIILGKDPQKAIDAIAARLNVSKSQAGRLVMTEEAYFSSMAQNDCFKDLDVDKYEIVATLDSITSDICRSMDGKVFKMSEWEIGVTAPPFHPWCRTTTVPAFDDDFGLVGERAAKDEKGKTYYVPANMTYKQWEKTFVNGGDKSGLKPVQPDAKMKPKAEPDKKTKITGIDDCKTVEDVVDLFKSHDDWFHVLDFKGTQIKSVDGLTLDGVDLESAKSVYRPFERVFERFPQLKGKLNAVNSAKMSGTVYAQCSYGIGNGGIGVNTTYFGDNEKLLKSLKKDVAAGFHPVGCDTADSIVMHELGHAIDDYLTNSAHVAGFNGWTPKKVSAMLRPKVMKATGFKVSDVGKQVSGYATKDCLEWFAECFSEYMCSPDPRPVAKEFGKQLEDILKGVN